MIKCEPINGQEIIMIFPNFRNDIALAADKVLELNKDALSDRYYGYFEQLITSNKKNPEYEEHVFVMNDKISISLHFDKDQNLMYVDTLGFW